MDNRSQTCRFTQSRVLTLIIPLLAAACSNPGETIDYTDYTAPEKSSDIVVRLRRPGVMPKMDGVREFSLRNASAPAGAHLTYFGGRVDGSTQVIQVLWGAGTYDSHVTSTATPSMATFFSQLLSQSSYSSWLDGEYNTVAPSGTRTNQHINKGSFVSQRTITPSVTSATISDAQIQSEITRQVNAGHLPPPVKDSQGNTVTYYAVFFPKGKTITQGGSNSCQAGGFCAYHGTVSAAGSIPEYYYGVHPDMEAGSGCDTGCGTAGSTFGNMTSVASHELTEMITDAEVGLATINGPPLAWYDATNGEIGDICNAQLGTFAACDGTTYTVQTEFSNAQNNCVVAWAKSCTTGTNDFSVAVSPASLTIARGSSGSATISTATTAGSAQSVALSVSGAPSGLTATVSPASVTSGSSATVSVSTTSAVAAGTYALTITGTATSGSHTAALSVTVTATTANNFSIAASPSSLSIAQGGSGSSTISTATTSGSAQTVSLSVSGAPSGVTATITPSSVSSGQSATLSLAVNSSAAAGSYTLTVTGSAASGSHTATVGLTVTSSGGTCASTSNLIANGGFESGAAAPWVLSAGVLNNSAGEPAHSGSWDAWLDGYGASHTDSAYQSISIPSGACTASLSFWLHVDTAETTSSVAYDTLKVQVRNSANTVLATLATYSNLNKNTGYVQKSFDLSAFKGQTIRVYFLGTEDVSLQTSFVLDDIAVHITQ